MNDAIRHSIVRPTLETPFRVDFEWWKKSDNNWRVYLLSCLCPEHQAAYAEMTGESKIDWVDPVTAEITGLDGLEHVLMTHCSKQPDFLETSTTLVDTVFRALIANGNKPLTPAQLGEVVNRPADTILKTLSSGGKVYKGIRPVQL